MVKKKFKKNCKCKVKIIQNIIYSFKASNSKLTFGQMRNFQNQPDLNPPSQIREPFTDQGLD